LKDNAYCGFGLFKNSSPYSKFRFPSAKIVENLTYCMDILVLFRDNFWTEQSVLFEEEMQELRERYGF
jgi:hypothetical protein